MICGFGVAPVTDGAGGGPPIPVGPPNVPDPKVLLPNVPGIAGSYGAPM
jgi:hypothetical protein